MSKNSGSSGGKTDIEGFLRGREGARLNSPKDAIVLPCAIPPSPGPAARFRALAK